MGGRRTPRGRGAVDFTFDDEQLALQDVARAALERECDPEMVRTLVDEPTAMTPALWSTLVELGWTGLLVPTEFGGAGTGLLEMTIVAEQMGRRPLPGPFFSSAIAATLAAKTLGATELLADLGAGTRRGTIALQEQGHGDPLGTVRTRARRKSADWVVSGIKPFVVDGHSADWVIVVARSEEGVRSYLLEEPKAELVPSLDPTRKLARLVLEDRRVIPLGPGGSQSLLWQRIQDDVAVALAAETVGAADRALAEAIAYTSQRIVFDRPVTPYQTVRPRLGLGPRPPRARAGGRHGRQLRCRGRGPGDRRRHPAPRRSRLHLGQRRPLPLQAGQAERSPDRRGRPRAQAPGLAVHRVGLSRPVAVRFELRPITGDLAARYRAEGAWDDRSLGQFLADALLADTTRRFRVWAPTNPSPGTVGDVYEDALRVAGGLRELGLGPGDVVAFQLPNWVEAAITFYACAMLGVTLVPIVHFYGPKEVGFILRQSQARALVIVSSIGSRDYLAAPGTLSAA